MKVITIKTNPYQASHNVLFDAHQYKTIVGSGLDEKQALDRMCQIVDAFSDDIVRYDNEASFIYNLIESEVKKEYGDRFTNQQFDVWCKKHERHISNLAKKNGWERAGFYMGNKFIYGIGDLSVEDDGYYYEIVDTIDFVNDDEISEKVIDKVLKKVDISDIFPECDLAIVRENWESWFVKDQNDDKYIEYSKSQFQMIPSPDSDFIVMEQKL